MAYMFEVVHIRFFFGGVGGGGGGRGDGGNLQRG